MNLKINSLKSSNILNSYNFARASDVVFSEIISTTDFQKIDKNNKKIIFQNENFLLYFAEKLIINNGDIIFSNSDLVEVLFDKIRNTNLSDLILITSQTDRSINKKLYLKKPINFKFWFSINVNKVASDLISIPYGLANTYSYKNLKKKDYVNLNNKQKIDKIYFNFELNTNYFHRIKFLNKFNQNRDFVIENKKLSNQEYLEKINNYRFIFCPWGNGVDTHRVWESLYAGSIPIVPKHLNFKNFKNLPIIQFQNIKELKVDYLLEISKNLNFDYLNIELWINEIKEIQKNLKNKQIKEEVSFDSISTINYYNKFQLKNKRKKDIYTFLRKVHFKIINSI